MLSLGLPLDAFVFPILVKFSTVEPIHGFVLKLGYADDQYIRNAIMDAYGKRRDVLCARKLFDEMPERTSADWNAMLSGYWYCGCEEEAGKIFFAMPSKNVISFTAMVTGYCKMGKLDKAKEIFDEMPERNVVSWNAMISGYGQNDQAESALKLFNEMLEMGIDPDETTWVTVVSACSSRRDIHLAESLVTSLEQRGKDRSPFVKTALIDMYAKCGNLSKAKEIFDDMGLVRNSVSWNAMISGFCREGNVSAARDLFDRMPRRNLISWNSMISGYVQNGQWGNALKLFKSMAEENLKPDEVTMVSVLSACGHLGALETARQAIEVISKEQINLSISAHNALIFMHSRCGSLAEARRAFDLMLTKDVISYNSLLSGLASHGYGNEAETLLQRMKDEGLEPDRITYLAVLTACSHGGQAETGRKVFKSIPRPTVEQFACMVDLLGRAGKLDEAASLIANMPMAPQAGVYGALLHASRIHWRVDLAELAATKLFDLEPDNPGNYVILSNIYAASRRWEESEMVRERMRERNMRKEIGCSWVEFKGEIHCFTAGDQTHYLRKEIYHLLEQYGKKMKALGYAVDRSWILRDVEEEEEEGIVGTHSERLAVGFVLLAGGESREVIRVVKNLRICGDCHLAMKMISKISGREIVVRDTNRFHSFRDGSCSCGDYW